MSGYGTDQQLLYYQHRGFSYSPGLVILLFHPNDVENNSNKVQYWYNKPRFRLVDGTPTLEAHPVPEPRLEQRVTKSLAGRTFFFARLYRAGWILANRARILAARLRTRFQGGRAESGASDLAGSDNDDLQLTGRLILTLHSEVGRQGAALVVVSVPTEDARLREYLKTTLEPQGIPYLPLDDAFAATSAAVTFEHDGHWNTSGHRVAAAAIERFLIERGILGGALATGAELDAEPQSKPSP